MINLRLNLSSPFITSIPFLFLHARHRVLMAALPQYAVYQQRLHGEAELARAQQNRQIAVNEAQSEPSVFINLLHCSS